MTDFMCSNPLDWPQEMLIISYMATCLLAPFNWAKKSFLNKAIHIAWLAIGTWMVFCLKSLLLVGAINLLALGLLISKWLRTHEASAVAPVVSVKGDQGS
ncbi:hypothetical protein [Pseudomonas putida]|uniref:Uncharacterized protein n=1 Tax=Pseudomonas putida TaxID=303 RepID=A0A8I1EBN8_PSEPU|nr:hypothetical protein [Pseudomonas putida]MBI6882551.1 hypothetical protein [Pseudomonas putida]